MLLHRLQRGGSQGDQELRKRIRLFDEGQWGLLLESSRATQNKRRTPCNTQPDSDADWAAKLEKAEKLAGQGELSSAARLLRSNGLAPGNNNTLQQLCDPLLRPRHRLLDFPPEVLNYTPDEPVQMDRDLFIANLRSARRAPQMRFR